MSIQQQSEVSSKRLMAEVNELQSTVRAEHTVKKAELDKLMAEINALQIAAIKERNTDKAKIVKQKTKQLFEEQFQHVNDRRNNTREQLTRLTHLQQHEETAKNPKLQHQLAMMIKKKKGEFIQLNRDATEIKQKASQKSIPLKESNSSNAMPERNYANVTEQAKAEAEKLISDVAPKMRKELNDVTSGKAEEAGKLIDEINRLQASADAGTLTEEEAKQLEERVMRIESKQKQTKDEINQLTQAKIKYELALAKSHEELNARKQRKVQEKALQEELNELIQEKENEQRHLLEELDNIRHHTEQEAAALKAQRDTARAIAEKEMEDTELVTTSHTKQTLILLGSAAGAVIVFIAILVFSPLLDIVNKRIEEIRNPPAKEQPTRASNNPVRVTPKKQEAKIEASGSLRRYSDKLSSGGFGPRMSALSGGSFIMGSSRNKNESPEIKITLNAFSISIDEVTIADYQRFARKTGRKMPENSLEDAEKHPIVNVTWDDANAYTEWLTAETGHKYSLPSEREWEYAARAGTQTDFWWGSNVGNNNANCANCGSQWDDESTAPVGSFAENAFKLHDTTGNVSEWTDSCYHENYMGAPPSDQKWEGGLCSKRVVRGGAYDTKSTSLRVTKRMRYSPGVAKPTIGFRIRRSN